MDRNQAASAVAETLGESSDRAEQVLMDLFREHAEQNPSDWDSVRQILESGSIDGLAGDQVEPLHGTLQELAAQNGNPDHPGGFFDDPELQNYFASASQEADAGQAAGVPVAEGSTIYQVDEVFYLGEDHQVQLWKAEADGSAYYHDGTNSYDELGQPLGTPDAETPDARQTQQEDPDAWNTYLAANGPRWDGTEDSWQQFRDWFLYDAAQNQVGDSAQGFIAYAESGDKREIFTSYGITLPEATPTAAAPATANPASNPLHDHVIAQFKASHPELAAELGDTVIARLVAEVAAEQQMADSASSTPA